jgi:hypothetical protein
MIKSLAVFLIVLFFTLCFGAFHNLISFKLSPELFQFVFIEEFEMQEYGGNIQSLAILIGVLSCISLGLIFGILYGVFSYLFNLTYKSLFKIILIHFGITIIGSLIGFAFGYFLLDAHNIFKGLDFDKISNLNRFHAALGMHNGTYVGAFLGLIISFVWTIKTNFRITITPK